MSELESRGHTIKILARDKDVLLNILDDEQVKYQIFGSYKKSIFGKIINTICILSNYLRISLRFKPDYIVSKASFYGAFIAKLLRKKGIIFPDSEVVWVTNKIVGPLSYMIITPAGFEIDYGKKHYRIGGLFENCYLHPGYFEPDESIISNINRPYTILRFIGWNAGHDINNHGFSLSEKINLVEHLKKISNVYITSEDKLPGELEKYRLLVSPSKIHHVLYFADLYIGDSQTMAAEAALTGTPAIRSNSFVGSKDMSNFKNLENRYKLIINLKDISDVIAKSLEIIQDKRSKERWLYKRENYFKNTGDTNLEIISLLLKI